MHLGAGRWRLKAKVSVTVRPKANVRGNIEAPIVNIAEGATFNGSIKMEPGRAEAGARPAHSNAANQARTGRPMTAPEDDDMWKRERPEPVSLEQVMTEQTAQVATSARLNEPARSPAPVRDEATTQTAPSTPGSPAKTLTIGRKLRFKGDLVADEDLVIQG